MDSFQEKYPKSHKFLNESAMGVKLIKSASKLLSKAKVAAKHGAEHDAEKYRQAVKRLHDIANKYNSPVQYSELEKLKGMKDKINGILKTAAHNRQKNLSLANAKNFKIQDLEHDIGRMGKTLTDKKSEIASLTKSKDRAITATAAVAGAVGTAVGQKIQRGINNTKQIALASKGKAVAAGVLATAAIAVGYKIYKRYISEVGRRCGNLKGAEYEKCENTIKKQGIQKSIDLMTKLKAKCNVTKDPVSCKKTIDEKIASYKNKMAKLS